MINLFALTIALFIVLTFASVSGLMAEKAGVTNIAVEGMMIIGALVVAIMGTIVNKNGDNNCSQLWVLPLGGLVAGVFAFLHAFPSITLKSNQIISGVAINILALGIALFLVTSGYFGEQTMVILSNYTPINIDKACGGIVPMALILAIVLGIGVFLFFKITKQGMRYAMVGENPHAIDAAGISVHKYRYLAVFLSGVIAGIGGGLFVLTAVGNGQFTGNVLGYGFLGIAIMIFGQWKIHYMILGAIGFSFLFALGQNLGFLTTSEEIKKIAPFFRVLPFGCTIITMIIFSKSSRAPAAVGIPFYKDKR
ncbi:ribose/galactose ABC transporter permease [Williamsoniiplasma lucivorax]|uniref:Ribose/galactose ABC transporter permease n=2 Tax=Williamsoniiplasma lucivorax TaxID=209274 RepID=A0A2S5RE72_9MOLU|nr:ABC transporter permease [Williamsoniiplasma lucivorax]PPE05512.1 ribose/galactose ABC transporter permease [Williamsoniiplasma lucivorax]